jgi:DNA-directed RNA polymerase specialized sigma54-like protein
MFKIYIALVAFALVSCEKKEAASEKAVLEKAVNNYEALIEKAKGTEAVLQKKADSIVRQQDELGMPR